MTRLNHPYAARDRGDPGGHGAAARRLGGGAGRGRREHPRALDPRFVTTVARGSSDHAAAFLKYAIELTAGVPVASRRPVDRLDLWREAEARRLGLPGHLAVGQEPRHRRHGQGGAGRRRADHRHHQHRRLAAGARPPTMRSTSCAGAGKKRRRDQDLRQFGRRRARHPGALDRRRGAACSARPTARAFPQGHRLRLDGPRRRA